MSQLHPADSSLCEFSIQLTRTEPDTEHGDNDERTADRCYHLIASLTDETQQEIKTLADDRLARLGIWNVTGDDLLHDALLAILSGTQLGDGRHPRLQDVHDTAAFTSYLKGIVNAFIMTQVVKCRQMLEYASFDDLDGQMETLCTPMLERPDVSLGFTELQAALFCRLKARCDEELFSVLQQWEQSCGWLDEIPDRHMSWHQRIKLRALAQAVCHELGYSLH